MDTLRKFCESVPGGMTGKSLYYALIHAFSDPIEKELISADFTQDQIKDQQPSLIIDPGHSTIPSPPFGYALVGMVRELGIFEDNESMNTTRNQNGEEYSTLVRNLVTHSGELTDKALEFCKSADRFLVDEKYRFSRYYRLAHDDPPYDNILYVYLDEYDGKKYTQRSSNSCITREM